MQDSPFFSQPHRSFFLLGMFNAIIMMVLFVLSYKGVLHPLVAPTFLHVYSLAFLVFLNFFTGFLFTTFPRFNQTEVIEKSYYSEVFFANFIASILFASGVFGTKLVVVSSMLVLLGAHGFILYKLYTIYKNARVAQKSDSFWILSGMGAGLFAHILFLFSFETQGAVFDAAVGIAVFLYLLFTAFSVAQRMIPFFSHSLAVKNGRFVPVVFGLLLLDSIFFSASIPLGRAVVEFVLAIIMIKEFLRWQLHPFASPTILWVLHLALFWLPLGFFLSALAQMGSLFLETSFYFAGIHLVLLGFLTTVLVGFGTRVILGHSGSVPHADRLSVAIFIMTQVVVVARAAVSFEVAFGWGVSFLFDIAAALWTLLFVVWSGRFAKVLLFK